MENVSLPDDGWDNATTASSSEQHIDSVRTLTIKVMFTTIKVIFTTIGSVGVLDNLFVIIVFALFIKITDKTMNILLMNQSILDLGASVFLILRATVKLDGTGMSPYGAWDQFVCHIFMTHALLWSMLSTSTYGILLTALDRYVAVVYPIWYNENTKTKKRVVYGTIALTWFAVPALQVVQSIFDTDIIAGTCVVFSAYSTVALEQAFTIMLLLKSYVLPLVVMAYCYAKVVYVIRNKVGVQGSAAGNAATRNAVVTSLMICCGFIACWTPNQFSFFLWYWAHVGQLDSWFHLFTVFLAFANSCINPFIYAAHYREFQQGVRRLMNKLNLRAENTQAVL